jgi:hypothetical protein
MQSLTPVSYPASIVILQTSLENKIDDVNFGNSYIAVDARRDQTTRFLKLMLSLYRGIRIGGMIDNDLVSMFILIQPTPIQVRLIKIIAL